MHHLALTESPAPPGYWTNVCYDEFHHLFMNTEQVQPEEESKEGGKPKKENDTEKERKTMDEYEEANPSCELEKDSPVYVTPFVSLSRVRLFATLWTTEHQASLSITNSQSPPKPMSIELVMPSNHLILCSPLLLLPPIPPSIRDFSNESALCIRLPKYWSFSFNISPSNEHPGLISFRMDWMDLLAVQGTLKSLLQHHSSKASILWRSAFFIVQLSHPYMMWKNHGLD